MIGDLRVLLRYGIVGYMMLFFDLIFVCSYVERQNLLNLVKDAQLGIMLGIMGLPFGWLCYQLWDQCINKYWIPEATNIKRIREWEKGIRKRLEEDKVQVNGNLPDHTIKVIANISLVHLKDKDQKGSSTTSDVSSDPRGLGHSVYSDSQQARGVMWFVLPCVTYANYVLIAVYMALRFGLPYVLSPMDTVLYLIAILLPVLISLISFWGFNRVRGEQSDYAWAILSDKEDEIKRLIESFYRASISNSSTFRTTK